METNDGTALLDSEINSGFNFTYGSAINTVECDTSSVLYNSVDSRVAPTDELPAPGQPPGEVSSEKQPIKLFKRRWYILALYSFMSASESLVWNTWSPISNSVQKAFGWNDGDISLLANWGPITYLVGTPIFVWLIETKGLRWSMVTAMLFVGTGSWIRCIPTPQPSTLHKWLMNAGQIIAGFGGPVGSGAMTALSAQWFGPTERATATAIPMVAKNLALAGSFIIDATRRILVLPSFNSRKLTVIHSFMSAIYRPLLVPDVPKNSSGYSNRTEYRFDCDYEDNGCRGETNTTSDPTVEELNTDISLLLELEAGYCGLVFLLILAYFPRKPPSPPCQSAAVEREDFCRGLKLLVRNGNFWLMTLVSCLIGGFNSAWISVLSLNIIPIGVSQKEAGWIGFYSYIAASVIMLLTARIGDFFANYMKWYIGGMFVIAAAVYVWFALICIQVIPFSTASVFTAIIVGQTAMNAATPLMYELAGEIAYPVGEATSCGVLTAVDQAATIVFLLIMMVPHIGTMWLNWGLLGAVSASVVLVLLVQEKHGRLELDDQKNGKSDRICNQTDLHRHQSG